MANGSSSAALAASRQDFALHSHTRAPQHGTFGQGCVERVGEREIEEEAELLKEKDMVKGSEEKGKGEEEFFRKAEREVPF